MGHGVILVLMLAIAVGFGSIAVVSRVQSLYRRAPLRHLFVFTVALNTAAVLAVLNNYFLENLADSTSGAITAGVDILYRGAAGILLLFVFGGLLFLLHSLVDEEPPRLLVRTLLTAWAVLFVTFLAGAFTGWHLGSLPVSVLANVLIDQVGQWVILVEIVRALVRTVAIGDEVRQRLTRWFLAVLGVLWLTIILLSTAMLNGIIAGTTLNLAASAVFVLLNGAILAFLTPFARRVYEPTPRHGDHTAVGDDFVERFAISPREREVVELICRGLSNQEIADRLFISVATVKDHNHHVFRKTGVHSRTQLIALVTGL